MRGALLKYYFSMKLTIEQLVEVFLAIKYGRIESQVSQMTDEQRISYYLVNKHALPASFEIGDEPGDTRKRLAELMKTFDLFAEMEIKARTACLSLSGKERTELRSGLRQGINDSLHRFRSGYFEQASVKTIDRRLTAKNLPSLDNIDAIFGEKHRAVLKRGRILNDEEFYAVKNILDDLEYDVSAEQRIRLGQITLHYENSRAKPKK